MMWVIACTRPLNTSKPPNAMSHSRRRSGVGVPPAPPYFFRYDAFARLSGSGKTEAVIFDGTMDSFSINSRNLLPSRVVVPT
jgi:hypothetical protein